MARRIDERQYLSDQTVVGKACARHFQAMGKDTFVAEQAAERHVQGLDLRFVKAAALQSDHVQAGKPGAVADDAAERNHIRFHPETPPTMAARPMRTN